MKQNMKTVVALLLGMVGVQAQAKIKAIEFDKVQDLSQRYSSDTLSIVARSGVIFSIDGDNRIFFHEKDAKSLITNPGLNQYEPSTVDLMKEILQDATTIEKKDFQKAIMSTQDYKAGM